MTARNPMHGNRPRQPNTVRPKKALGQNFLVDENVIGAIVEGSGVGPEDTVIEIGPGRGALTVPLARAAERVVAIELDGDVIPVLRTNLAATDLLNVTIRNEDVLETDLAALTVPGRTRVVGNLPYYITTPILLKLLESRVAFESVTVMMQREVADRVLAVPGSKEYGVLSVSVQYFAEARRIVEVDRTSFRPVPNVDSTVLRLDLRKEPAVRPLSEADYFKVVKAAFSQRRKTLANSLLTLGLEKDAVLAILKRAAVDPTRRAETLSLKEFAALSDAYTCASSDRQISRSGVENVGA